MKSDPRSERSRLALVRAGMALLIDNRNASLSDVAHVAGVGRATLYRHFQSKAELIRAIAESCNREFEEATRHIDQAATSWLDAIRLMFEAVMPLEPQLTFLMKLETLIDERDRGDLFKEQEKELLNLVQQCQEEQSATQDVSPEWLLSLLEGLFYSAWKMVAEHQYSHRDAAKLAFDGFCFGVAQRS